MRADGVTLTAGVIAVAVGAAGCTRVLTGRPEGEGVEDGREMPPDGGGALPLPGGKPDARPGEQELDAGPFTCTHGDRQAVDVFSGHCYMAFFAPLDHAGAAAACAALGGHLAVPTGLIENAFVLAAAPTLEEAAGAEQAWLGGRDEPGGDDQFAWVTGEPFGFAFWRPGQPDHASGGQPEDCVAIDLDREGDNDGTWSDLACTAALPYVCEHD